MVKINSKLQQVSIAAFRSHTFWRVKTKLTQIRVFSGPMFFWHAWGWATCIIQMAKLYRLPLNYCKSLSIQVSLPTPQHPNTFSRKNFENNRRKSTQVLCSTYWISTRIRWQPLGPCIGQSAEHAFPPIIELAHKLHHVSFIVYNLLDGGNYYAHRFISCVYTMYFTKYISSDKSTNQSNHRVVWAR